MFISSNILRDTPSLTRTLLFITVKTILSQFKKCLNMKNPKFKIFQKKVYLSLAGVFAVNVLSFLFLILLTVLLENFDTKITFLYDPEQFQKNSYVYQIAHFLQVSLSVLLGYTIVTMLRDIFQNDYVDEYINKNRRAYRTLRAVKHRIVYSTLATVFVLVLIFLVRPYGGMFVIPQLSLLIGIAWSFNPIANRQT